MFQKVHFFQAEEVHLFLEIIASAVVSHSYDHIEDPAILDLHVGNLCKEAFEKVPEETLEPTQKNKIFLKVSAIFLDLPEDLLDALTTLVKEKVVLLEGVNFWLKREKIHIDLITN